MRVVFVPFTTRWLSRFNQLFSIDKSSYNGHFKSRLGAGYCAAAQPFRYMEYTFLEMPQKRTTVRQ